jgi:hypothetical protein
MTVALYRQLTAYNTHALCVRVIATRDLVKRVASSIAVLAVLRKG